MAKLTHNIIKMKLVSEGYLHNYPYHLISDKEMCKAFLNDDGSPCFFYDNYPCLDDALLDKYNNLVSAIKFEINDFLNSLEDEPTLPDWVYAYMLGSVISINSPQADIHDMLVLMNLDNDEDEFNSQVSASCYNLSTQWLNKLPPNKKINRVPTLFGEPHIIKHIRLMNVGVT